MRLSPTGLNLIASFEGLRLNAYHLAGERYSTIGYGHYGPDVRPGSTITKARALELLKNDVAIAENQVRRNVKVPLSQPQFDALASFAFNIGGGAFTDSTLLKKLNAHNYGAVPAEMARWVYGSNHQKLGGLVVRRRREGQLFASVPASRPPGPHPVHEENWVDHQHELNRWTNRYLKGVAPLLEDGIVGPATQRRIRWVKFYLGYGKHASDNSADWTSRFVRSLRHPRTPRRDGSTAQQVAVGINRRRAQKTRASITTTGGHGVSHYDGKPVATWIVPYLTWARQNGWGGSVNSGYRDPTYSEQLCKNMCGRPTCPGKCAGRSSNHSGKVKPKGAVDVSDYATFARLMARAPFDPRLHNALGAADPVHFSATGH